MERNHPFSFIEIWLKVTRFWYRADLRMDVNALVDKSMIDLVFELPFGFGSCFVYGFNFFGLLWYMGCTP